MLHTTPAIPTVPALPVDDDGPRFLVCPACGEMLAQPDVETFSRCPYCDHVFVKDQAMEDFLLEPTVKAWVRSQNVLPIQFRLDEQDEPPAP